MVFKWSTNNKTEAVPPEHQTNYTSLTSDKKNDYHSTTPTKTTTTTSMWGNNKKKNGLVPAQTGQQQQSSSMNPEIVPNRATSLQENKGQSMFQNLNPVNENDMPSNMTPAQERTYKRMKKLQYIMDDCFEIPIIKKRMGLDPLIGFIPWFGDFGSALISVFMVAQAAPELSRYTIVRMLVNLWIDAITGIVPFVGDIFDIGWKANERNVAIFEDHIKSGVDERTNTDRKWLFTIFLTFFLFCFVSTVMTVGFIILLIWLIIRLVK